MPRPEVRKNTVDKRYYVNPQSVKAQARAEVEKMQHKAFWVHNPDAYNDSASIKSKDLNRS